MTSAVNVPSPSVATVRQQPLTAIESPSPASAVTTAPSTVRRTASLCSSIAVTVEAEGKTETVETDQVLMAVGRAARTRGLGLEALSIATEKGFVTVSPTMARFSVTSVRRS